MRELPGSDTESKMVATRRSVRVCSPDRNAAQESSAEMEATPATRRTRRTAAQGSAQPHSDVANEHQHDEEGSLSSREVLSSTVKRKTRTSKRQEQKVAPPDTTHEADVSESESCSSVAPESESCSQTCSGRRRTSSRRKAGPRNEVDEVSETESCCSSASTNWSLSAQRTTRSQRKRLPVDGTSKQGTEATKLSEAESCSSVLPKVSRTRTRAMLKSREEDAEYSEPDSCSSSISGLCNSTVRRVTRASSSRAISPIPMDLDREADSDTSRSRRMRASRAKLASVSESQSYDSEGFESGPSKTPRRSTRIRGAAKQTGHAASLSESESGSTDVYSPLGSPSSVRAKSTLCISHTGSGNSTLALAVPEVIAEPQVPQDFSRLSVKVTLSDAVEVMKKKGVPAKDCCLDSEDPLAEELEQDKTLTAEDENEKNEELQVTVLENVSTNKGDSDEEQGSTVDTSIVAESSQIQTSPKIECNPSTDKETILDDQGSAAEMESNRSVKVFFTECAPMEEDKIEVGDLTDQETQQTQEEYTDKPVNKEAVDNDPVVPVEKEADQPKMRAQKPSLFLLLDSSEEEDESDDGGELADERESERSDSRDKNGILDGSQAGPSKPRSKEPLDTDGLFVVDTQPGLRPDEKYYMDEEQEKVESSDAEDKSGEEFIDEGTDDDEEEDAKLLFKNNKSRMELSSTIDPGLKVKEMGGLYITFDSTKLKASSNTLKKVKEQNGIDELLKKSIIGPDFEKKDVVPPYKESQKTLKLKRREERERTTGDGWFNMKAPEVTQELQNDLQALKMRSAMDPKRFYKKNDREGLPKYLQMGTVVECPLDFYHSRIPKKERKRTIVEELLADTEFRSYNKKKFKEIMVEKAALAQGRSWKKKNKFSKKGK